MASFRRDAQNEALNKGPEKTVDVEVVPEEDARISRLKRIFVVFPVPVDGVETRHLTVEGKNVDGRTGVGEVSNDTYYYRWRFDLSEAMRVPKGHEEDRLEVEVTLNNDDEAIENEEGDPVEVSKTWNYTIRQPPPGKTARIVLPPRAWANFEAMADVDRRLLDSIIRSIFGKQDGPHFGIKYLQIRPDCDEAKDDDDDDRWDKGCM